MIQIAELRIGNILSWNPTIAHPHTTLSPIQIEVTSITQDKIGYVSPNMEHRVEPFEDDLIFLQTPYKQLEELEPVLLTTDVIEKCGFVQGHGKWKKIGTDGQESDIEFKIKGGWHFEGTPLPVQPEHLHQLQNVYYILTGQELLNT